MNREFADAGHDCPRCYAPLEILVGASCDERASTAEATAYCATCWTSWTHLADTAWITRAVKTVVEGRTPTANSGDTPPCA